MLNLTEGTFSKRGHFRKNWKNRFFVLELGRLSYFDKENSTGEPPYGTKFLKSVSLRNFGMMHHDNPCMIVLVDPTTNADLWMKATDVETAELWRMVCSV